MGRRPLSVTLINVITLDGNLLLHGATSSSAQCRFDYQENNENVTPSWEYLHVRPALHSYFSRSVYSKPSAWHEPSTAG